jgi:hypothetical protein
MVTIWWIDFALHSYVSIINSEFWYLWLRILSSWSVKLGFYVVLTETFLWIKLCPHAVKQWKSQSRHKIPCGVPVAAISPTTIELLAWAHLLVPAGGRAWFNGVLYGVSSNVWYIWSLLLYKIIMTRADLLLFSENVVSSMLDNVISDMYWSKE